MWENLSVKTKDHRGLGWNVSVWGLVSVWLNYPSEWDQTAADRGNYQHRACCSEGFHSLAPPVGDAARGKSCCHFMADKVAWRPSMLSTEFTQQSADKPEEIRR